MRKIKTKDVFTAFRAIKKANLKEELKPVIALAAEEGADLQDVGIEGFLTILEITSEKNSEKAIYEVLSGPFELPPEEIEDMEIDELAAMLGQLVKENNLRAFFSALSGLIISK